MIAITFDTLTFTEKLTSADVPEKQAKALAMAMSEILQSKELATKHDITQLRLEIARDIAETKVELLKWLIGLLVAQTGMIIAAMKLIH